MGNHEKILPVKIKGRHKLRDIADAILWILRTGRNLADGAVAERAVEPLLGYLDRMEKILADHAYKMIFMDWVERTAIELEVKMGHRKDF